MKTIIKRILPLFLCCFLMLCLFSCKKDESVTDSKETSTMTDTDGTPQDTSTPPTSGDDIIDDSKTEEKNEIKTPVRGSTDKVGYVMGWNDGKAAPVDNSTTYKYVVVIGVDGGGTFFSKTDTPNIDRIFANGAVTNRCLTAKPTISAQCWGSLLHGVTPEYHGLDNGVAFNTPYPTDSPFPSYFRVIRENDSDAFLASFAGWASVNVGIVEDGLGVHKVSGGSDLQLTNSICDMLEKKVPTSMFIQFNEVDYCGHTYGYGSKTQLEKITEIDSYIGRIFDAYKKLGVLKDTLFMVTADHGGVDFAHGGDTDAEKYVLFAARGKTVEKGEIIDMEIRDTAAIVLHALGYEAPDTWTARIPTGIFKGIEAEARPVYNG